MFWLGFLFGDENRKLKELERSRKQRELEEEEKKVSIMVEDFEPFLTSMEKEGMTETSVVFSDCSRFSYNALPKVLSKLGSKIAYTRLEKEKGTFDTSTSTKKTFEKYDFDLRGKKVAIIGLPKSQVERFKSLVLTEKGADKLEFIASSSHNDTELVPDKLKDFDIVVVVKRFVGHGTVYHLKTLLTDSSAQLVSSTSHGLDGLERALYRGFKGYPSEEGATVVDYPLLKA